jgi:acyl carrier protein
VISQEEEFSTPGKKITIPMKKVKKMLTVQDAVDFFTG